MFKLGGMSITLSSVGLFGVIVITTYAHVLA